jgi:hypothetical protein
MRRKFTALLALWSTGCASWQTQRMPQQPDGSSSVQEKLRVELRSGTELVIYDARIVGDSLVGMISPPTVPNRGRIAIATSNVQRVTTRQFSLGRTVGAVLTIGLATLVIAGASAGSSSSSSSNNNCQAASPPAPAA